MAVVIDLMEHMHVSLKIRKGGIIYCRCSIMCLIALQKDEEKMGMWLKGASE